MSTRTHWVCWTLMTCLCVFYMESVQGQIHQKIVAVPGDDVLLQCHLDSDLRTFTVEWSFINTQTNAAGPPCIVYRYHHRLLKPNMSSLYFGRTQMFLEGLKEGNCSLLIKNVTTDHQGQYRYLIPKAPSNSNSKVIELVIDPNHLKTTMTPQQVQNLQTSDPSKDTGAKGHHTYWGLVGVPVVILLFFIGYKCKKRFVDRRGGVQWSKCLPKGDIEDQQE